MKYKQFEPKNPTKIKGLGKFDVRLSNGKIFEPPLEYLLDYADSDEGVYSYRSEAGFWRTWIWGGQTNSEFIPNSYFVKLDRINIELIK